MLLTYPDSSLNSTAVICCDAALSIKRANKYLRCSAVSYLCLLFFHTCSFFHNECAMKPTVTEYLIQWCFDICRHNQHWCRGKVQIRQIRTEHGSIMLRIAYSITVRVCPIVCKALLLFVFWHLNGRSRNTA